MFAVGMIDVLADRAGEHLHLRGARKALLAVFFQRDGLIHPWKGAALPRGAVVYWPPGNTGDGHVAISNGDGTIVSNFVYSAAAPHGINPHAAIADFGPPLGWVDPSSLN